MPDPPKDLSWIPLRFLHRSEEEIQRQKLSVHRRIDPREESVNALTHAFGLVCSFVAAGMVIYIAVRRGGAWEITACAVYAATLIAVYAASTLSHVLRRPRMRHRMRVLDQAIIFLFIAGCYTPIALTHLRDGYWWVLHGLIWAAALSGFIAKAAFVHNVRSGDVTTKFYLLLALVPIIPFLTLPWAMMGWLFAGGLFYVLGMVFFHYDHRVRYFHAVWHMMVIAGSACHFMGVLFYCTSA